MRIDLKPIGAPNVRLPYRPGPGSADTFDRAAGQGLGRSSGGKVWDETMFSGTSSEWHISSASTAILKVATGGINLAVLDAEVPNGTLKVTAYSLGSTQRGGPAFRVKDVDNHYAVYHSSSTDKTLSLYKRKAGTASAIATSTYLPVNGDVYEVVLTGASIIFKVNGATVMTASDNDFSLETRHGLYGSNTSLSMGWNDYSFTAA